jgi:Domain of unknown function (DUF4336)
MLREIDRNIWVAEQPLKYFGLNVGTRMTVIRLTNGGLIVISPIQADDALVNELNKIGEVKYIIAPNLYHHLFVANFQEIYPQAKLWVVSGLESKRPDIPIDKIINDAPNSIQNEVDYLLIDGFNTFGLSGSSPLNECIFCHRQSRTLILTDIAFHFDETFSLTTQLAARLIGSYNKLSPSLLERFATKEKDKVKQSIQQVLDWDFERVIMAHGSIIEKDGKSKFKQGYEGF